MIHLVKSFPRSYFKRMFGYENRRRHSRKRAFQSSFAFQAPGFDFRFKFADPLRPLLRPLPPTRPSPPVFHAFCMRMEILIWSHSSSFYFSLLAFHLFLARPEMRIVPSFLRHHRGSEREHRHSCFCLTATRFKINDRGARFFLHDERELTVAQRVEF